MPEDTNFSEAVLACLLAAAPVELLTKRELIKQEIQKVLGEAETQLSPQPQYADIQQALNDIHKVLPEAYDRIALVAGGATKIKGYVFEAPRLPEIRGASALLDWVNEVELPRLWGVQAHEAVGDKERNKLFAQHGIIYASGGGFLAFAPADQAQERATAIERCYTKYTLTANSVAVWHTFSLLELRYGRLGFDQNNNLYYWIDQFREQWEKPELQQQLASYYYGREEDSLDTRFYRRKTFGELVTLLTTMTDRRRNERATYGEVRSVPFYQLSPWDAKCASSDVRSAVVTTQGLPDNVALSQASARKAYIGRKVKRPKGNQRWYTDVFGEDIQPPESWEDRFNKQAIGTSYYSTTSHAFVFPAQDVGEIAQASDPEGYIGIIYADGNNVGRRVATAATPYAYHKLSSDLDASSYNAVLSALATHLRPAFILNDQGKQEWVHPFEIITIGGDDLLVIVPGSKALDITLSIAQNFEKMISDYQEGEQTDALSSYDYTGRYNKNDDALADSYTPSIGLSAGVIIAQENAPIFFLRDLVEELLKNAKELAKENAKHDFYGGAVDFMVMKSITMVSNNIKSFRRQALGDYGKESNRRLTARPYTWHEFAGLLKTVRELKQAQVPRSQLYRLRRALDADAGKGITSSVMEYLYTRVRLRSEYSTALNKHVEQPWCWETSVEYRSGGLPPWMPIGEQGWETIWADMLEAYEMVPDEVQP